MLRDGVESAVQEHISDLESEQNSWSASTESAAARSSLDDIASNELSRAMASKLLLLSTFALLALHEFFSDLSAENCYVTAF